MVFVREPIVGSLLYFSRCLDFVDYLDNKYDARAYYLYDGRQIVPKSTAFHNDQQIRLCLRLPGGKGGFGSNLRAQGNRLSARKRAGNYESCRDLATGLRLRDLQRARVVKAWEEGGGEEEARRRKEREYRERVERRVEEEERKLRRVDGKDTVAIERAHEAAAKIEQLTATVLDSNPPTKQQQQQPDDKGKQIVCGWEDDLEHF